MISWSAAQVAEAAGATLVVDAPGGPAQAVIDTRAVASGDLFVGLVGERVDGGRFAGDALAAGAWGVLVGRSTLRRWAGARCSPPTIHCSPSSGSQRRGGVLWTRR